MQFGCFVFKSHVRSAINPWCKERQSFPFFKTPFVYLYCHKAQYIHLFWSGLTTQWKRTVPALKGRLTSATPNSAAHAPPLHSAPFFTWPLRPSVLWQRSDRTLCPGCHDNDLGRLQSEARWSTDTLAYTLRQGKRSIFYYTEGGWVGQGELHCSELTAETREITEGGECVLSVSDTKWACVCMCVRDTTFVIGQ